MHEGLRVACLVTPRHMAVRALQVLGVTIREPGGPAGGERKVV
jgi:hypothetical protein